MSSAAAAARARDAARALGFDLGDFSGDGSSDAGGAAPPGTSSGEPDTLVASLLFPADTPRDAVVAASAEFAVWSATVVPGYVWSGDALRLRLVEPGTPRGRQLGLRASAISGADGGDAPVLQARLHYGDAPGDEWYALWLLAAFTARTATPSSGGCLGAVLHAVDGDGEVFAIETADALPRWCTPAAAARRFYVAGGRLHLIPLATSSPSGLAAVASPAVGAAHVRAHPAATLASQRMQAALAGRLHAFPAAAAESVHVARVVLPLSAARLLASDPSLVGPTVAAFAGRDPSEVQVAARMRHFPPAPGFATVSLPLSRHLIVQLLGQGYHPPAALGRRAAAAAAASDGATAPSPADISGAAPTLLPASALPPPGSPGYRPWDLGLKLAAGLEILLARGGAPVAALLQHQTGSAAAEVPAGAAAGEGEAAWRRFTAALTRRGFFEGCRSVAEREQRTASARAYFSATTEGDSSRTAASAAGDDALLDAAAADAADGAPAPAHKRDGEPAPVRAARALLVLTASSGDAQPPLPTADRDDSLGWLDELTADDDDDPAAWAAREAADRARLAAESATMLRRLGLAPVPLLNGEGARASLQQRDDAAGEGASDNESEGDGQDEDDDSEDDGNDNDDSGGSDDGALFDESTPEGKQLGQLLASLSSFMRGASGLEGVEGAAPAVAAAARGSTNDARTGGSAKGATTGTPPSPAPATKPGGGRKIDVAEFATLLSAHRAVVSGDANAAAAAVPPLPATSVDSDDGDDALLPSGGEGSDDEDDDGALPASRRRVRFGGGAAAAAATAELEPSLRDVMAALDAALLSSEGSTLGSSFETLARAAGGADGSAGAAAGGLSAADVRYNLLSSLAASVGASAASGSSDDGVPVGAAAGGAVSATAGPGPAANLLAALGVAPPRAWWRAGDGAGDAPPVATQTESEGGRGS